MFKRKMYTAMVFVAIISLILTASDSFATTLTWTFYEDGMINNPPPIGPNLDPDFVRNEIFSRVTDGEVDIYLRNISGISISTITVAYKITSSTPPTTPYPDNLVSSIDINATDPPILACNDPNYTAPDQPGCMDINAPPSEMRFQHYFTSLRTLDLGYGDPVDSIRWASLSLGSVGETPIMGVRPITQEIITGALTERDIRIRWDWNDITQTPIIVFEAMPVPEPTTLLLLGSGLLGLGLASKIKRDQKTEGSGG